jgi:hypothetical protein
MSISRIARVVIAIALALGAATPTIAQVLAGSALPAKLGRRT